MWVMSKSILLLLLIAATPVASAADDLTKLKAALAERFAAYRTLHVEFTTSGPDPLDYSKTVGARYLWEQSAGMMRFEGIGTQGELTKSVWTFDGTLTTLLSVPVSFGKPAEDSPAFEGTARVYRGPFARSESDSNMAAWFLGSYVYESQTSVLEVVSDPKTIQLENAFVNGHSCLVWEASGKMPGDWAYVGRLAVDVQDGWLPVLWERVLTRPNERTQYIKQIVTDTSDVMDEITGENVRVPRKGQIIYREENDAESPPQNIEFTAFALGHTLGRSRFQASIPTGYRVRDETSNTLLSKEYISGGPAAEKAYLAKLVSQSTAMQVNQPSTVVNASIPEGPSWSLWVFVGICVFALSSLIVRRL